MKLGLKNYPKTLQALFVLYLLLFSGLAQAQTASTTGFNCGTYKQQFQLTSGVNIIGSSPVYCFPDEFGL